MLIADTVTHSIYPVIISIQSPTNEKFESQVVKKSSSQRVHDAAEQLCYTLFNTVVRA